MVKILLIGMSVLMLLFADVKCQKSEQRITCTYYIDRSDNTNGLRVEFHWISPSGKDDRIKIFRVPPFYGSVYDYRFLPGREPGKWKVVVKELDTNKSAATTFDINCSDDSFFEE
ncbi:hypothetical protein [Nitratiruptor sp. YY09-18]|uniref:hypothetical protein n=1 Tax=Nitratiruptor sp. YY09-18 TaxID=2724901 RepID=UPI0019166689|nr:hypothetical protein [Nitratiruptor sp. YY09-18]BCD68915.1 hypothetical protein NitYY0918_C1838 [Nitratiruptor sp. YY09-18]